MEKILNRSALAEELGIGSHVKERPRYAIALDGAADPVVGVDRHRALFDDDLIGMDGTGNLAGNRVHIRQIGVAGLALRGPTAMKMTCDCLRGMAKIGGELDLAAGPMPAQQLGKKLFVNRYQTLVEFVTLSSSLSTHKTRWPISAKHAAATKPTYPDPTTVIAMDSLILILDSASSSM